jgi:hypothetical protein
MSGKMWEEVKPEECCEFASNEQLNEQGPHHEVSGSLEGQAVRLCSSRVVG